MAASANPSLSQESAYMKCTTKLSGNSFVVASSFTCAEFKSANFNSFFISLNRVLNSGLIFLFTADLSRKEYSNPPRRFPQKHDAITYWHTKKNLRGITKMSFEGASSNGIFKISPNTINKAAYPIIIPVPYAIRELMNQK